MADSISEGFGGFAPDAFAFLAELEVNNTTEWFHANKPRYQAAAAVFAALVAELIEVLPRTLDPRVHGEARVGGSLFRINRDTRFSHDKSPYKDHLDAIFWLGGPDTATAGERRNGPSLFLRLTADQVTLGSGVYGLKGPDLSRYRDVVASPRGAQIARLAAAAMTTGATMSEANRVKPPRPFPADHERADLLRRDGFYVVANHDVPDEIAGPSFVPWLVTAWKPLAPVASWLADALG